MDFELIMVKQKETWLGCYDFSSALLRYFSE